MSARRPSDGEALRRRGLMLVLSSPSGAGKTTITRALLERDARLEISVSVTTRPRRSGEVDGRDYHFVDRPAFEDAVKRGAFMEWAEVHGNLYGTSIAEIDAAQRAPGCGGIIFDIDYQGARQIRAKVPDVTGVFILPPSMPELLRRLRGRASETEEVVKRRFEVALREIEHYGFFDYVLVNGRIVIDHGRHTGARPGHVLYGPGRDMVQSAAQ